MANAKNLTLSAETAESLFLEVEKMRRNLEVLREKIIKLLPARYGNELWWKKGNLQAKKEVKEGKYYFLKTADDLDTPPKKIYK